MSLDLNQTLQRHTMLSFTWITFILTVSASCQIARAIPDSLKTRPLITLINSHIQVRGTQSSLPAVMKLAETRKKTPTSLIVGDLNSIALALKQNKSDAMATFTLRSDERTNFGASFRGPSELTRGSKF